MSYIKKIIPVFLLSTALMAVPIPVSNPGTTPSDKTLIDNFNNAFNKKPERDIDLCSSSVYNDVKNIKEDENTTNYVKTNKANIINTCNNILVFNKKVTDINNNLKSLENCSTNNNNKIKNLLKNKYILSSQEKTLNTTLDTCIYELKARDYLNTFKKDISKYDQREDICDYSVFQNIKLLDNNLISNSVKQDKEGALKSCDTLKTDKDKIINEICKDESQLKAIFTGHNKAKQIKTYNVTCPGLKDLGSLNDIINSYKNPSELIEKPDIPDEPTFFNNDNENKEREQNIKLKYLIALGYKYLPLVNDNVMKTISLSNKGTTGVFLGDNIIYNPKSFTVDSAAIKTKISLSKDDVVDNILENFHNKFNHYKKLLNDNYIKNHTIKGSVTEVFIHNYNALFKILDHIYKYVPPELSDVASSLGGGLIPPEKLAELYNNYDKSNSIKKEFLAIVGTTKQNLPNFKIEANFISGTSSNLPRKSLSRKIWSTGVSNGKFSTKVGSWKSGEFYPKSKPIVSDFQTTFNYGGKVSGWGANRQDFWKLNGGLDIKTAGKYCFSTKIDDGTKLWVNNKLIVNDWGSGHGAKMSYGCTNLKVGIVPIRLQFYDHGGKFYLVIKWKTPNSSSYVDFPKSALLSSNSPECGLEHYIKDSKTGLCVYNVKFLENDVNNNLNKKNILSPYNFTSNLEYFKSGKITSKNSDYITGSIYSELNKNKYNDWLKIDLNSKGSKAIGTAFKVLPNETYKKCLLDNKIDFNYFDINSKINIYIDSNSTYESLVDNALNNSEAEISKIINAKFSNIIQPSKIDNIIENIMNKIKVYEPEFAPDQIEYNINTSNLIKNNLSVSKNIFNVEYEKLNKNVVIYTEELDSNYAKFLFFNKLTLITQESNENILVDNDRENCSYSAKNLERDFDNLDKIIISFSKKISLDDILKLNLNNVAIKVKKNIECEEGKFKNISIADFYNIIKPWLNTAYNLTDFGYLKKSDISSRAANFFIINADSLQESKDISFTINNPVNTHINETLSPFTNKIENICNKFLNFKAENEDKIRTRISQYSNFINDLKKKNFAYNIHSTFGSNKKPIEQTITAHKKIKLKTWGIELYWSPGNGFCSNNITNGMFYVNKNSIKSAVISFAKKTSSLIKSKVNINKSYEDIISFAKNNNYDVLAKNMVIAAYYKDNNLKNTYINEFLKLHNYDNLTKDLTIKLKNKTIKSLGLNSLRYNTVNKVVNNTCKDHKSDFGWKNKAKFMIKSIYTDISEVSKVLEQERLNFMNNLSGYIDIVEYNLCINDLQSSAEHALDKLYFNLNVFKNVNDLKYLVKPEQDIYFQIPTDSKVLSKGEIDSNSGLSKFKGTLSFPDKTLNKKADFCNNLFTTEKLVKSKIPKSFKNAIGYNNGSFSYDRFYTTPTKDLFFRKNPLQPKICKSSYTINNDGNYVCSDGILLNKGNVDRSDITILIKNLNNQNNIYLALEVIDLEKIIKNSETGISKSITGSNDFISDMKDIGNRTTKTEDEKIVDACIKFKNKYRYTEVTDYKTNKISTIKDYYNSDAPFIYRSNKKAIKVTNCNDILSKNENKIFNDNIDCKDSIEATNNMFASIKKDTSFKNSINSLMDSTSSDFKTGLSSLLKQASTTGAKQDISLGNVDLKLTANKDERVTSLKMENIDKFEGGLTDIKQYDLDSQFNIKDDSLNISNGSDTIDLTNSLKVINDAENKIDSKINAPDTFMGIDTRNMDKGTVITKMKNKSPKKIKIETCKNCKKKEILYKEALSKYDLENKKEDIYTGDFNSYTKLKNKSKNSQFSTKTKERDSEEDGKLFDSNIENIENMRKNLLLQIKD